MSNVTKILDLLEDMHEAAQESQNADWGKVAALNNELKEHIEAQYEWWLRKEGVVLSEPEATDPTTRVLLEIDPAERR